MIVELSPSFSLFQSITNFACEKNGSACSRPSNASCSHLKTHNPLKCIEWRTRPALHPQSAPEHKPRTSFCLTLVSVGWCGLQAGGCWGWKPIVPWPFQSALTTTRGVAPDGDSFPGSLGGAGAAIVNNGQCSHTHTLKNGF